MWYAAAMDLAWIPTLYLVVIYKSYRIFVIKILSKNLLFVENT